MGNELIRIRRHPMDSIQEQVSLLTGKVDALHQMIDQIKGQISAMHASAQAPIDEEGELKLGAHGNGASHRNGPSLLDTVCEHKDILMDSSYGDLERQNTETHLSQDIQIQRLTAQLTAAYNRIAALEEQLLAIRVH